MHIVTLTNQSLPVAAQFVPAAGMIAISLTDSARSPSASGGAWTPTSPLAKRWASPSGIPRQIGWSV
jgi:hypothetical protein